MDKKISGNKGGVNPFLFHLSSKEWLQLNSATQVKHPNSSAADDIK